MITAATAVRHESNWWLTAVEIEEGVINSLTTLQAIIEYVPVGMTIVSQDTGEIMYANPEAVAIMGRPQHDITVDRLLSLAQLVDTDGHELAVDDTATNRARQSGRTERATLGMKYPTHTDWFRAVAKPMTLADGRAIVITSFMDINDVIKAQHQQAEMIRLQDELSANISHELRTPLAIILGFASELVEWWDNMSDDQKRTYMGFIHKQASTMNWLIRSLLVFYRSEATGLDDTQHEPLNLTTLVADGAAAVRDGLATKAGVKLTVGILEEVAICGHPIHLELALNNLLMNAVKFSPPGSTGGTVHVELGVEGEFAVLTVTDTGIGITPTVMAHLYEPFRQGDGSDTRRYGGVGIGLSVVKKIIDAHHGRIEVESEPGKGSTFRVYLPLLEATAVNE